MDCRKAKRIKSEKLVVPEGESRSKHLFADQISKINKLKFMYLKSIDKLNETEIIDIVEELKPERNSIIDKFNQLGVTSKSSLETGTFGCKKKVQKLLIILLLKNKYLIIQSLLNSTKL